MKTCRIIRMILLPGILVVFLLAAAGSAGFAKTLNWAGKPVLGQFLLDPDLLDSLRRDLHFSPAQIQALMEIVNQETMRIEALEAESLVIVADRSLSLAEKRKLIQEMGYNTLLASILSANQERIRAELGDPAYGRFVQWVSDRWETQFLEGESYQDQAVKPSEFAASYPRSFEVYATRYDAGDRYIVALPDQCLKFANGGAMQCNPGYQYGQNYSVAISYQGKIVVAAVGEAGPWNIDDNFWSKTNDPQPRRMFTDLPLGVPAAQAAYFNGYNGGLDQFGRVVTSPVAIDISYAVAKDLGLPSGNNKVTVSFLWTEGWDDPGVQGVDETQVPAMAVTPVIRSTPNPDGSVVHQVQQGQTLSGIAEVYGIPLGELLALNGLDMGSILLPGDRVIVKSSQPTAIAGGATEDVIVITRPTLTPTPSSTPIVQASPPPGIETAALPAGSTPGASAPPSIDPALMIIAGIGIAGIGLLLWGLLVNRRNQ